MNKLKKLSILIIILNLIIYVQNNSLNCLSADKTNQLTGCLQCDPLLNKVFVLQINKYNCTDISKCTLIKNNTCIQCQFQFYLSSTNTCILKTDQNCIQYNLTTNQCIQCNSIYQLVIDNTNTVCVLKNNTNCIYNDKGVCIQCKQNYLDYTNNCLIFTNLCLNFDYLRWQCIQCALNMFIHSSGIYCVQKQIKVNCLQYDYTGCLRCKQQYVYNSVDKKCVFNQNILLSGVTIYNIEDNLVQIQRKTICIKNNQIYNISSPTKCSKVDTNTCADRFFKFKNQTIDTCILCSSQIENCILCKNKTYCLACSSLYFQFQTNSGQMICKTCQTYGCKQCQKINNNFQCLSCNLGQTLFNGTCYSCDQGFYFQIINKKCIPCQSNCALCNEQKCLWCKDNYILNSLKKCQQKNITSALNQNSIYELFLKNYPNHQQLILKNSVKLMSSCNQNANPYSCICSAEDYSSLCYNITNLKTFTFANINMPYFMENTQMIRIFSELTNFDIIDFNIDNTLLSQQKIGSLLQIYTNMLRRRIPSSVISSNLNSNRRLLLLDQKQILSKIFSLTINSFSLIFSTTQVTTLYGNGYYFKYYPTSSSIDSLNQEFISVSNGTSYKIVYIWFDKLKTSSSLSGHLSIYSDKNQQLNVKIKQINFPSNNYQQYFKINAGKVQKILKKSTGFISFNVNPSTTVNPNYYTVSYSNTQNLVNQLYFQQRIQNIFYQPAFVYILIFLVLYLFFIPFCSLVDLCRNQGYRRKRVKSQDISVSQSRQQQNQAQQQPQIVIAVNYKDFFPIYNVSNTPRPRRIVKLCLFLLNLQHGITFLTLIYFNMQPDHPVLAIVLGLPVYFCTIIMGYIAGLLTIYLPSFTKYLINLIAAGYWIIWIVLMPRFQSSQYHPYVFVLAITFFMIDMLMDLLQTFMVYFTIKQSQRQIKMFQCLAAWLSKRGFYQYDKLAKQLNQV